MSSKKKNFDDELSDISSDEEKIVKFASKNTKTKNIKKMKKKEDEDSESEEKNKKILSKKTKREKKEKDSDSDNSSSEEDENKKKPKKNKNSAQNNYEEEKKEKVIKSKEKKKEKKKKEDSSEDDDDEEEKKRNKKEETKKKKSKKEKSDSEESDSDSKNEIKNKKVQKKYEKKKEDSDKDEKSDSEDSKEEIKPKKKKEIKKVENSDSDDDEEENKEEKKDKDKEDDNEGDDEPKLVKNEYKEEENKEKEKKSYNSGTWPELFVNNLSYKTTEESLKKYFSKYGEVESTKIVYDKESGRSKGVGFCKFCDSSSAAEAIKDNDNLYLEGRPISVSYSNDKKGSAKVRKSNFKGDRNYQGEKFSIFIGNLSFKTNEDGIKNLFEDCGKIIDIRIAKREDGKPRGFAHVDFDSNEALENALGKTGYKLDGRELRIDRTTNKPSTNKGVFGEHSYNKNKNSNKEEIDIEKAKKTGKIINTGSKSQKIENSDDEEDDDE